MKIRMIKMISLFFLLPLSQIAAQDLDKYYTQRVQEGGDIYFVFPNEDFKNPANHTAFLFDITIREDSDSAIINFTYYSKDPASADSLIIISETKRTGSPANKIYVDFVKKKWEQRYSAKVSFAALQNMVSPEMPFQFEVKSKGLSFEFQTKSAKWQKYADALNKIFYIIDSN